MTPLDGLTSWLLIGALTGLLAGPVLRTTRDGRFVRAAIGAASAVLLGGLPATRLGYGGLAATDSRALLTAVLSAVFVLLVVDSRRATA